MYNETISQYYIYVFGGDLAVSAQDRTVENRPYTDLRPLHFGVLVGTHVQDVELMNAGPQIIVAMTVHSRRRLSLPLPTLSLPRHASTTIVLISWLACRQ